MFRIKEIKEPFLDDVQIALTGKSAFIKAMPVPYSIGKSFVSLFVVGDVADRKRITTFKECIFITVVEFIKWYNEQKLKSGNI